LFIKDFTTKSEEFDSVDIERFWGDFTWRLSDCEELVGVTHRR
jgi:hypothetical protein